MCALLGAWVRLDAVIVGSMLATADVDLTDDEEIAEFLLSRGLGPYNLSPCFRLKDAIAEARKTRLRQMVSWREHHEQLSGY